MFLYVLLGIISIITGAQFYLFSKMLGITLVPSILLIIVGILSILISFIVSVNGDSKDSKSGKKS